MSELGRDGKVMEGFHITGKIGYSLVMGGNSTSSLPPPPPPEECVSSALWSKLPPYDGGEVIQTRYLTYSKNGGPKQQIFTAGVYGPYETPANINILNNQDNTRIAFFTHHGEGEPIPANQPEMPFESGMPEITRVALVGMSMSDLPVLLGTVANYTKRDYYISGDKKIRSLTNSAETDPITTLIREKTTLTFYPTVGAPPEEDDFYLMDGSDTAESLSVVSCASVPFSNVAPSEED